MVVVMLKCIMSFGILFCIVFFVFGLSCFFVDMFFYFGYFEYVGLYLESFFFRWENWGLSLVFEG